MIGTYLGLLGAFIGVIVVPTRRIPELAAAQPLVLAIWALSLAVTTAAFVTAIVALSRRRSPAAPLPVIAEPEA
jgi:hypothetical protein